VPQERKSCWNYIAGLLLFGSNGIVASGIALDSYKIVYLRCIIGIAVLLLLFLLTRQKRNVKGYERDLCFLAISGAAMGGNWLFLYEAYQQIGVGTASLLCYCGPVIVMALAPILFHEKLTLHKCLGFLVVLVGVFLINGQAAQEGKTLWGLFCGGMSAVMYAVLVIANKKVTHIVGMENVLYQLLFSTVTVAIFLLFREGLFFSIPADAWRFVLLLGVVNTGLGCYLYFSSIGRLSVQSVAVLGYLEPFSAVVLSAVLLREGMSLLRLLGVGCILGGAMLAEMGGKKTRSSFSE